ncbi:MAG: hypothetical protein RR654_08975 [Oscillospiraceae bacterium]
MMAKDCEHLEKFKHNKDFLNAVKNIKIEKGEKGFYDWEITIDFYICVHIIEYVLALKFGENSDNHDMRFALMHKHKDIFTKDLLDNYKMLKDLSKESRYYGLSWSTTTKAFKAQTCLETVRGLLTHYIPKQ